MTINSSGVWCDVCGDPIWDPEDRVNTLKINGIESEMHCDNKCKAIINAMPKWQDLPDGPLRKAYEKYAGG